MAFLKGKPGTRKGKQIPDQSSPSALTVKTGDTVKDPDITQVLQRIQVSLDNLNKRCDTYDKEFNSLKDLREDLYEADGIDARLKYTADQSEFSVGEITDLRCENDLLKRETQLLRAVVIRMDKKINEMDREITDLRGRSMRDNILIHNFAHRPNENLAKSVPEEIKKLLGVDVQFVRIHRNGPTWPNRNKRPVTITGRLADRSKKDEILQAQKSNKEKKVQIPFYITAQEPAQMVSDRNRLYDKSNSLRSQDIMSKVAKNGIIMPNGEQYVDEVPYLTNADILQISHEELEELDNLEVAATGSVERDGNVFFGNGGKVHSYADVEKVYKKVCCMPDSTSSDHRTLVYRFQDEDGKLCESYFDDGEYGAGRRILRYMRDNGISDVAVVITRWCGGKHVGFERFRIMEMLVNDLANDLDEI